MNTLKKKTLNLAVGAALGAAVVAPASADSLLAPLVVSVPGIQTFLQVKVQGQGTPDSRFADESDLHYYWYQKGSTIGDLRVDPEYWSENHFTNCEKSDSRGFVSPWDMVFQSVAEPPGWQSDNDYSEPRYVQSDFVGFMILDDEVDGVSVGYDPAHPNVPIAGKEGQFSGTAYVVNFETGQVADYKLLNNHKTARSGDFGVGFISKKTVDLQWWPTDIVNTAWLVLAVGSSMTQDDTDVPSSLSAWPGKVVIDQHPDARVPFGGQIAVYDNDEMVYSGGRDVLVECMALVTRYDFMTTNQEANTRYGGWTRKNLTPVPDAEPTVGNPNPPTSSNGAIVYRWESEALPQGEPSAEASAALDGLLFPGLNAFTVETSGHLNGAIQHPNRPY
jgi:hypothetical protein